MFLMFPNGPKYAQIIHNFPKLSAIVEIVTNGMICFKMIQNGPKVSKMIQRSRLGNILGEVLPSPPCQTVYTESLVMLGMNIIRSVGDTNHPQHLSKEGMSSL